MVQSFRRHDLWAHTYESLPPRCVDLQAWRSLDLLRLKSGLDAGLDARLIELRFSLQVGTARRGWELGLLGSQFLFPK